MVQLKDKPPEFFGVKDAFCLNQKTIDLINKKYK